MKLKKAKCRGKLNTMLAEKFNNLSINPTERVISWLVLRASYAENMWTTSKGICVFMKSWTGSDNLE